MSCKNKQDRCSRLFFSFCPVAATVFAPLNSRIQSTIHFSATVRLSAPVQQNKLKFCLLFHQTRTWLRGVNGLFKQSRLTSTAALERLPASILFRQC